jgi:hypothetical protein
VVEERFTAIGDALGVGLPEAELAGTKSTGAEVVASWVAVPAVTLNVLLIADCNVPSVAVRE